jgi:TPR repeat protein
LKASGSEMRIRGLIRLFVICSVVALFAQERNGSQPPSSLYDLGLSYLKGGNRNDTEAIKYIRSAAEKGFAPAQVALGYFYESSLLVSSDPQQAVSWYKKAADQGSVLSELSLGRMYYTGANITRDLDQAAKWLQRSADKGEPISQFYLGLIKEEKDYSYLAATELYRKAAGQGLGQAQQKLAYMLDQGRGVPRRPVEAYLWYVIASDSHRPVSNEVNRLEGEIGSTLAIETKQKAISLERDTAEQQRSLGCFEWDGREWELPAPPPPTIQQTCRR